MSILYRNVNFVLFAKTSIESLSTLGGMCRLVFVQCKDKIARYFVKLVKTDEVKKMDK